MNHTGARRPLRPGRTLTLRVLNDAAAARRGHDPRKTADENAGRDDVFARPDDELDWPQVPARQVPTKSVRALARQGRGADTAVAHVAPGEIVIPRALQSPEVLDSLRRAAAARKVPLGQLTVGDAANSINPNTGAPEFGIWGDLGDRLRGFVRGTADDVSEQAPAYTPSWETPPTLYEPENIAGPDFEKVGRQFDRAVADYVAWPVQQPVVTSGFGPRRLHPVLGVEKEHNGVDFRAHLGDPIFAPQKGKVLEIVRDPKAPGGNTIRMQYDAGGIGGFAHTGALDGLKVGQEVWAGDQIGVSDGTGLLDAPHLHYTYIDGTPENPASLARKLRIDPLKTQFRGMPRR